MKKIVLLTIMLFIFNGIMAQSVSLDYNLNYYGNAIGLKYNVSFKNHEISPGIGYYTSGFLKFTDWNLQTATPQNTLEHFIGNLSYAYYFDITSVPVKPFLGGTLQYSNVQFMDRFEDYDKNGNLIEIEQFTGKQHVVNFLIQSGFSFPIHTKIDYFQSIGFGSNWTIRYGEFIPKGQIWIYDSSDWIYSIQFGVKYKF